MKPATFLLLGVAMIAQAGELLEQLDSGVFEAAGTQRELAQRAKSCIAQNLRFDAVQLSDSTDGTSFLGSLQDDPFKARGKTTSVAGGNLLVAEDLDGGVITANSRVPFKAFMSQSVAQSVVTVLTKDGRFKVRHTNIVVADLHTGALHNEGFKPVDRRGKFAKRIEAVLEGVTTKLADCVRAPPTDDCRQATLD